MTDTQTAGTELLAELVKTRRELRQLQGRPSFSAPEADVPDLMGKHGMQTSGVVIVATDTGREWTLLGSRGWVQTYQPPATPLTGALDAVAAVTRMDTAFLTSAAVQYGPDSVPAANLRELIALRKLADLVRRVVA